jgi:hypothetical protein
MQLLCIILIRCQKWTYWPLFVIVIAAFTYSTYDFFTKNKKEKEPEHTGKQQSIIKEKATSHISISSQNNQNSLHDSKVHGQLQSDYDSIKVDMVKK